MSQQALTVAIAILCIAVPFSMFMMAGMKTKRRPYACPVCDHDVPENAQACPRCGAPMTDQQLKI